MAEAVFKIRTEGGADVAKLLADVERLTAAAQTRIDAGARTSRQRRVRESQGAAQQEAAGYRQSAQAIERSDVLLTRSKLRELAKQGEAQRRFHDAYRTAVREATQLIEAEVGKRENLSNREKRQIETLALAIVSSREAAERRVTQIAIREERERTQARARMASHVVGAIGQSAGAARGVAADIHGQIQNSRDQRAALQESVIGAVSQVGVTDLGEVNRLTDQVLNAGIQHGLSPQAIAQAVAAAQTQFSTLGAMDSLGGAGNAGARSSIYQSAIDTAVQGRNLGVDPGEFSRLMGMLGSSGMTATDRSSLAAWTVGAQDRGAVETGSVTREALGPIMQRMSAAASALGPSATLEQRSAAMRDAYRQAFAELQVFKGLGETVRRSGNAMVGFERALTNNGVLTRMRGNIDAMQDPTQKAAVRNALFDRSGALRSGLNNPLAFASALMGAGMTDSRAIANLFAGSGAGNPMSLQSNWRNMLVGLTSRDANGRTGADRVNAMLASDVALSPEQQRARAALYEGSDRAKLNSEEASRLKALSNNTSEINRLSNTIASWSARNPMLASALPAAGGVAATLLGATGTALAAAGGGFAANSRAIWQGVDLQGNRLSAGERLGRAALQYVPGLQLLGAAVGARDAVRAGTDAGTVERLLNMLPGAIASAVSQNPPQLSQHDAAHAATVAQSQRGAAQ